MDIVVQVVQQQSIKEAGAPDQCISVQQKLQSLLHSLSWSYAAVWTFSPHTRALWWNEGYFRVNEADTEDWNAHLFYCTYKSCTFDPGVGSVGLAYTNGRHIWLNGDAIFQYAGSFERSKFLKTVGIETTICIPWLDSVLELGTSKPVVESLQIMEQIQSIWPYNVMAPCSRPAPGKSIMSQGNLQANYMSTFTQSPDPGSNINSQQPSSSSRAMSMQLPQTRFRSRMPSASAGHGQLPQEQASTIIPSTNPTSSTSTCSPPTRRPTPVLQVVESMAAHKKRSATKLYHILNNINGKHHDIQKALRHIMVADGSPPNIATQESMRGHNYQTVSGHDTQAAAVTVQIKSSTVVRITDKAASNDILKGAAGSEQDQFNVILQSSTHGAFKPWGMSCKSGLNFRTGLQESGDSSSSSSSSSKAQYNVLCRILQMKEISKIPQKLCQLPTSHMEVVQNELNIERVEEELPTSSPETVLQGPEPAQVPKVNPDDDTFSNSFPNSFERGNLRRTASMTNYVDKSCGARVAHDESAINHMMAERRRRMKQKENFTTLRKLVPIISKAGKVSTLEDAAHYLRDLQSTIRDLESSKKEVNEKYENLENICKELERRNEELEVLLSGGNKLTYNVHHPWGLHRMPSS